MITDTLANFEKKRTDFELRLSVLIRNEVGKFQYENQIGINDISVTTTHTASADDENSIYGCTVDVKFNPSDIDCVEKQKDLL